MKIGQQRGGHAARPESKLECHISPAAFLIVVGRDEEFEK